MARKSVLLEIYILLLESIREHIIFSATNGEGNKFVTSYLGEHKNISLQSLILSVNEFVSLF